MKKVYLFLFFAFLTSFSFAQVVHITGPSGSESFGSTIINLDNGNFVVSDPLYDEAGIENIGAVYVYDGTSQKIIASVKGSRSNDYIGREIHLVDKNTILIYSTEYDGGKGALTLFSPEEDKHIKVNSTNSLVGREHNDLLALFYSKHPTEKYLSLGFPYWSNYRGAVMSHPLSQPLTGLISATNSFVGTSQGDRIAENVQFKKDYIIISSPLYSSFRGAVTVVNWNNCKGEVNPSRSLIGSNPNEHTGLGITFLKEGRSIVVSTPNWNDARGAVTFIDLANPTVGVVSAENSLVGKSLGDAVASSGVYALENNNYVIASANFNSNRGAVTWGSGTTGIRGTVSSNNSFMGENRDDFLGWSITPLSNGNYVISSPFWNQMYGAVTWADGNKKLTGTVSNENSLVGQKRWDRIGEKILDLGNGDYGVIGTYFYDWEGTITWGNGQKGITGYVTPENSLLGISYYSSTQNLTYTLLANGNGVLTYPDWKNHKGAVVFLPKGNYPTGEITSQNALVGTEESDNVGSGKVVKLTNGNFVVTSSNWNHKKGAVTWGHATRGISGIVSAENSIIGFKSSPYGREHEVIPLTNGNYVAHTNFLNNPGESVLIWGNGTTGTVGEITPANSLQGPNLTITSATPLKNGNYAVISNQNVSKYTALTVVDGSKAVSGTISNDNSLIGYYLYMGLEPGYNPFHFLNNTNDFIFYNPFSNRGNGSVTWIDDIKGITGEVTNQNSILGSSYNESNFMIPTYNYTTKSMVVGRPKVNMVSIFKTEVVTGLDEIQETVEKQTILSPNPSSTFSALRSKKEDMELVTVKVIDQLGQVLFFQSGQISKHISLELMTQSLKPGIYHLEVTGSNYVEKHRLVKQ